MTIKQDIADVYYDWWETGAKEHIAETEAAVTGVPIWQREISQLQPGATGELGGYTPDKPWATHYTKAGAPGTKAWLQARAEDIRIEAAQAKLKSTDALSRAIAAADIIKASGKVYTRVGYQKELARLGGFSTVGGAVSALRYGTKTEAQYYKEYGVSQEAMRKAEASARAAEQAKIKALGVPSAIGVTPFWERTYPSMFKGALFEEQKGVEAVTGIFGALDYKPADVPPYYEKQIPVEAPGMAGRGTLLLRTPTEEEMTPEQRVQFVSDTASTKAWIKSSAISANLAKKYQDKYNSGELNLEQAQTQYGREYKKKTDPIKDTYNKVIKEAEDKYETKVMELGLPHTFAKGLVFGGISVIAPPFALLGLGAGLGTTAFQFSRPGGLQEQFQKHPGLTIAHFGAGAAGAGLGAWGTAAGIGRIKGLARTWRGKPIDTAELVRRSILEGKQRFPTAPPSKHLKIFKEQKYKLPGEVKPGVWHATPEKFAENILVKAGKLRKGEPVGLFVAPEVSPHFLRLQATQFKLFGLNLQSVLGGKPGILRIYPKAIKPKIKGRLGVAELPLTKAEIQAVLPVDTWLKKISGGYYTRYKGQRIPIYQYEAWGTGKAIKGQKVTQLGRLYQKYYKPVPRVSFISPQTLAYSLAVSKPYDFGVSKASVFSEISKIQKKTKKYKPIKYKPSYKPLKYSFPSIIEEISKTYVPSKVKPYPYYPAIEPVSFIPHIPKRRKIIEKYAYPITTKRKVRRKEKIKKEKGYNVFGKPSKRKGQKQKGYLKLNLQPLTKGQAQSLGTYMTDTSLSRTFKLKKVAKPPLDPRLRYPKGYFTQKRHKLRDYRIKKGKKVPLRNKFIEKTKFILDTRQEKQKISLYKRLAQMRKGARKKPKKVSSRRIIKRKPKRRNNPTRKRGNIKKNMSNYLKRLQRLF